YLTQEAIDRILFKYVTCFHKKNLYVVKDIINKFGGNLNSRCCRKNGCRENTLLHIALRHDLGLLKYLVESGANVNIQNNEGKTPLHDALSCRQLETAQYLIESGADIN